MTKNLLSPPDRFSAYTYKFIFISVLFTIAVAVLGYTSTDPSFIYVYKKLGILWILTVTGIVFSLIWLFQHKNPAYKLSKTDMLLLAWTGWLLFNSLYNNHFSYEKMVLFSAGLSIYIVTKFIFAPGNREPEFERAFLTSLLLISLTECIIVLGQYAGMLPSLSSLFRVTGTFHNPAPVSLLLSCTLPVLVYALLFSNINSFLLYFSIIFTVILSIVVLVMVKNRTSWIAILFALIFIFDKKYVFSKYFKQLRSGWWKVVTLLALFAFLIWALVMLNPASVASRLLVWKISFHQFLEHPFAGSGFGSVKESFMKWQIDYFELHPDFVNQTILNYEVGNVSGWVKMTYNEYLEILVEQGIPGLAIFTILIINIMRNYFRRKDVAPALSTYAFLVVIVILILGLFSYPLYSLPNFLLFFFTIAILDAYTSPTVSKDPVVSRNKQVGRRLIALAAIIGLVLFASFLLNITRSYNKYALAKLYQQQIGDSQKAIPLYEECYSILRYDPLYLLDYGICLYDNGQHQEAHKKIAAALQLDNNPRIYSMLGNLNAAQQKYTEAEKMYKAVIGINPALLAPRFALFKFYINQNNKAKAIETGQEILSKAPKLRNETATQIKDSTGILLQSLQ
jgi:O-antigen polymerase